MIAAANADRRSFADFEGVGMKVLNEVIRPGRFKQLLKRLGHDE